MTLSVYERMKDNEDLFWLCFGAMYVTEMRRTRGGHKSPCLNIKSSGLATAWYNLCKKYGILTKNSEIREKNGVYLFYCTLYSLYKLLSVVKKIPDVKMDMDVRKSIKDFTYSNSLLNLNKTKIKILKILNNTSFTTNVLARKISYNSGNAFKRHLDSLHNIGFIKRLQKGKQFILNAITPAGKEFIKKYLNEIETVPKYSLYKKCFEDKNLASDLLLVVSELEMGGVMQNQPYLEMASKDFVEFVRQVCYKWGWTYYNKINKRHISGYSPVFRVVLNSKAAREIYDMSGPCADTNKDREYNFVKNLSLSGKHRKINQTKNEIIRLISNGENTSREIAFATNVSIQCIQAQLRKMVNENVLLRRKINGKFYYKTPE